MEVLRIRAATCIVFATFAGLFFAQTKPAPRSWGEYSRLATIESLVEQGTFAIDASSNGALTQDKVRFHGRFYSDKPPLLQMAAAPLYAVLRARGRSLDGDACGGQGACAYAALTFALVGLVSAWGLAAFFAYARQRTSSLAYASIATALLAFGTMVWPYSLVFNNDLGAGMCLFAAYALVPPRGVAVPRWRAAAAGLLAGLAVSLELLTVVAALALGVVVARRSLRIAVPFLAGLLAPLAITAGADLLIWGSPLPPYFAPGGYAYPGSAFPNAVAGLQAPRNVLAGSLHGLVGPKGLLSHAPLLAWPIASLVRTLRTRGHTLRGHAVAATLGAAALALFVFTRTPLGGKSFSVRYLLAIVPLLAFFDPPARAGSRPGVVAASLLVLAALASIYSAGRGAREPWLSPLPAFYVQVTPQAPYLMLRAPLLARFRRAPPDQ